MANLDIENSMSGLICGLDEVGRGPLVGPVTAACVYIPDDVRHQDFWQIVTDSKKLTQKKREMLFPLIQQTCKWGIGNATIEEIDDMNILQASLLAMRRAYDDMAMVMDHALIDGNKKAGLPCNEITVVKGDSKSLSIAAASIIAKVSRDNHMLELHAEHPEYAWDSNAGYGTKAHLDAIEENGITIHHRKTFKPISLLIGDAA
jgi:ribonuclease HII